MRGYSPRAATPAIEPMAIPAIAPSEILCGPSPTDSLVESGVICVEFVSVLFEVLFEVLFKVL